MLNNPNAYGGTEMLRRIFGSGVPNVEQKASRISGLPVSTIWRLLPLIAPILMSLIGKAASSTTSSACSAA